MKTKLKTRRYGRNGKPRRQGTRGDTTGPRFPPGIRVSVELTRCAHREIVSALETGYVPKHALCSQCRHWRSTVAATARRPLPKAQRTVVAERVEERDGKVYSVKVFKTPPRARFRHGPASSSV
jgi:hypothetical protein